LPSSLTHLFFDMESKFNLPIDNLPSSITHLCFDYQSEFNQSIDNLPNSITHLILGFKYNQKINKLPDNLIELKYTNPKINLKELKEKYPSVVFIKN
jgi:hypothetical protein